VTIEVSSLHNYQVELPEKTIEPLVPVDPPIPIDCFVVEGKTISKTKKRLEMLTSASHEKVVGFYEKALSDLKDIKFREWKDM